MAYKVRDLDGKPILFKGEQIFGQDTFDTRIEDFSNKERSFLAVASAESPDRLGDEIKVKGWLLEDYRKNPVVMPFHNYQALPVGRSLGEFTKRKRLMFNPQFAVYPETMRMYEMYRDKYLKGFSVGFVPVKSEPIELEKDGEEDNPFMCVPTRYLQQTLLEVSVAPVPAHQDALAEIKSMVQKGQLYIPARYLEKDEGVQIEEYDEYIHAVVNDKVNFSGLFVTNVEKGVKIVYGPHRGEDEKENHIHCFIFTEIEGLEDEYIEKYVKEKRAEKIEFGEKKEIYDENKYTEKETVIISIIPEVDVKSFAAEVVTKLEEGDDPAGGYLVPEETPPKEYKDIQEFYTSTEEYIYE